MPDRILGTVLIALQKIYRFPGSQKGAPEEFELDLPVQPVHDVSPIASLASGVAPINDGLWILTQRHSHSVGGTVTSTPEPFTLTVANGYPVVRAVDWVWWIYDSWAYADDAGDYNACVDAINHGSATVGPYVVGAQLRRKLLHLYGNAVNNNMLFEDADAFAWKQWPIRVLQNPAGTLDAFWWCRSTADGAGTLNIDFNMKFGLYPKGVLPPPVG